MSEQSSNFPSLAVLRIAHNKLLETHRAQSNGTVPDFWQEVEIFLQRGRLMGALLDQEEERWAAQSLLDYWTATAYSTGRAMPDAALVDFDPTLAPELSDEQCPYVGLAAFHEGREKYFFGRERLVEALLAKVATARLVTVVGPSGSGKSSLVLAGLLPLLKSGAIAGDATTPSSASWIYTPRMVPGSDPLAHLAQTIQPAIQSRSPGMPLDATLAAKFVFAADGLRRESDYLVNLLNETGTQPVVLVVDQFEEIFTLCTDEKARLAFLSNLLTLVQAPGPRHTVILTMRTDFESFVARVPTFLPHFEAALLRVTPLNAAELRAVIEKPAAIAGLKFETGVVDALVQDVLGEPAALPLLQFTLLKLWKNRARNRITWESYKQLGGGRLALARSADQLYANLIPEEQVTARRILLRLVRPGEGLEVTSNRVRQQVFYQTGEARDRVDRVLGKLVDADLLRLTMGERPEDTQVEVAHEALVRNWPRLVGWLEDDRERIRERLRVTEAAEQWLKLGRDPGALLRGAPLEEALRYPDLNELEMDYIQTSQAVIAAAEQEKEAARQRELDQALALAAEQERLAHSERQWAAFQQSTAVKLRGRLVLLGIISVLALVLAAAVFWFYSQAVSRQAEAEAQASIAATAQTEAEAQATAADESRGDALAQAAVAQAAQATAQAEAAAARTAEAELRAKQEQLRHLSAALNYTGEQLDELERLIGSARATLDGTTLTLVASNMSETTTPIAPPAASTPQPTSTPTPSLALRAPEMTATLRIAASVGITYPVMSATAESTDSGASDLLAVTPTPLTLTLQIPSLTAILGMPTTEGTTGELIAIVPDIEINLYAEANEDAPVLQQLRAPLELVVQQADVYWVKVAAPDDTPDDRSDDTVGWVQAWLLTYRGDISLLPRELRYLAVAKTDPASPVQNADKLPFTFGTLISVDGATGYALLDNLKDLASELVWAPVGTEVTLLFTAEGPAMYDSPIWYYVQLLDPGGQNLIWQGYLPAAVIAPR